MSKRLSEKLKDAVVVNDRVIEKIFVEDGMRHNAYDDPFEVSDADTMLDYLRSDVLVS